MIITEEQLIAYVDGELGEVARSAIDVAAATDPEIAARLARHRRLRSVIAAAHVGVLDEAVPERLLAAVLAERPATAQVIDLSGAHARRRAPPAVAQLGAMAACLAAGVIVGQTLTLTRQPLVEGPAAGLTAHGALERALSDQLAADQAGRPIRIGISFRSADGRYCRTFRTQQNGGQGGGLAGFACREPKAWAVRMAMAAPAEPAGAYSMAASPVPPPIAATIDQIIVGAPLDAAGEAKARANDWRD